MKGKKKRVRNAEKTKAGTIKKKRKYTGGGKKRQERKKKAKREKEIIRGRKR